MDLHWGCGCARSSTSEKSGVGTHLNGEPQVRVPRDQLSQSMQALARRYQVRIPVEKVVDSAKQDVVIPFGLDRSQTHPGMDEGRSGKVVFQPGGRIL